MSQTIPPACCPQCGRLDLRRLTWRACGSVAISYGCWDCDWITYPPGITATTWKPLMEAHSTQASAAPCSASMFKLRKSLGLSQSAFGECLGMTRQMVADNETGRCKWAKSELLIARTLADKARANLAEALAAIDEICPPNASGEPRPLEKP